MTLMSKIPILFLAAAISWACKEEEDCGRVLCLDSVEVMIGGDQTWREEDFELEVITPDGSVRCATVQLATAGAAAQSDEWVECDGDLHARLDDDKLALLLNTPQSMTFNLRVDGEIVVSEQLKPENIEFAPRYEGCSSVCVLGTFEVTIP